MNWETVAHEGEAETGMQQALAWSASGYHLNMELGGEGLQ